MRKIAANYIVLPNSGWIKNGYVEFTSSQELRIVDTGGKIRDLAGLEFYGGILVPEYIKKEKDRFKPGVDLQPLLNQLLMKYSSNYERLAIIEGADLIRLEWTLQADVRLL
jgi:hypothetical protein